jgi:hypothetical protein
LRRNDAQELHEALDLSARLIFGLAKLIGDLGGDAQLFALAHLRLGCGALALTVFAQLFGVALARF